MRFLLAYTCHVYLDTWECLLTYWAARGSSILKFIIAFTLIITTVTVALGAVPIMIINKLFIIYAIITAIIIINSLNSVPAHWWLGHTCTGSKLVGMNWAPPPCSLVPNSLSVVEMVSRTGLGSWLSSYHCECLICSERNSWPLDTPKEKDQCQKPFEPSTAHFLPDPLWTLPSMRNCLLLTWVKSVSVSFLSLSLFQIL